MDVPPPFRRAPRRFAAWRRDPGRADPRRGDLHGADLPAIGTPPPPPAHTPGEPPDPVAGPADPASLAARSAAEDVGLTMFEQQAVDVVDVPGPGAERLRRKHEI